jgi:MFS family permease
MSVNRTGSGSRHQGSLLPSARARSFLLLTALAFTGFASTLAALPQQAVEQGASLASAGLVTTVMLSATVAAQLLVPAAMSRLGTGPTLAVGLVLLGAPPLLLLLTPDLPLLLTMNAVRGVGFAVVTVVGSALTATLAPAGRHGEMVGLHGLAIAVPNLAVVPGAVWLAQTVGLWPVVLLAAAPVLAVPLVARLTEPHAAAAREISAADPRGARRAVVVAALGPTAVLTVVTLAGGALLTYLPIERPAGAVAAAGLLLFGLTGALARWRVGPLADRLGLRLLLPGAVTAAAAGMAAFATGLTVGHDLLLLAGAAVFGVGYGAVQNVTLVLAFARAGADGVPVASVVWNAGFDVGTGLGPVVIGMLAVVGASVPVSLCATAVLIVLALPVAVLIARPVPEARPSAAGVLRQRGV